MSDEEKGVAGRCREALADLRAGFPDRRTEVAEMSLEGRPGSLRLVGATSVPGLAERAATELSAAAGERVEDRVRRLPRQGGLGRRRWVLVTAAWVPARRDPSHRSEMVSQWLCGERLEGLERRGGWLRCRGPDRYVAWVAEGGVERVSREEGDRWIREARARSWGTELERGEGPSSAVDVRTAEPTTTDPSTTEPRVGVVPAHLPRGAPIPPPGENGILELPGGRRARAGRPDALLDEAERARRFPPTGKGVVRTARAWSGVPYLWGGRTESGVDCSGLVQSVYAFHGVPLPRDSDMQAEVGPALARFPEGARGGAEPSEMPDCSPGDLLFFAPEGRGITHVGLSTGGTGMVHAAASNGWVVEEDLTGGGKTPTRLARSLVAWTRPLASGAAGGATGRAGERPDRSPLPGARRTDPSPR